jgi:hypothetical protein
MNPNAHSSGGIMSAVAASEARSLNVGARWLPLILIWRVALDLCYVYILFPLNEYYGFVYDPQPVQLAESYAWTVLATLALPRLARLPSTYLTGLLLTLAIVPITSYFGLGAQPRWALYLMLCAYFIIALGLRIVPPIRISRIDGARSLALGCVIALSAVSVISVFIRAGGSDFSLDLANVYDVREDVGGSLYTGIWAYLYSWTGGAFCVALMVIASVNRHRALAALALAAQIYLFAATGNKVYLFLPLMALGTLVVYRFPDPVEALLACLVAMLGVVAVTAAAFDIEIVGDLIIRRVLFVPAWLSFVYYDFFSLHDLVFLTNSFLGALAPYPYGDTPTGMVVANYLGLADTNTVTGFLGTAYMNFGMLGIPVYALLVLSVLRAIDGCCVEGLPVELVAAVTVGPVRSIFTESDLFTGLLTHGLGVTLLLLVLIVPARAHAGADAGGLRD